MCTLNFAGNNLDAMRTLQGLEQPSQNQETIPFNYTNEDLVNIINYLASLRGINILLPQNPPLKIKLTHHEERPLSVQEAWELVVSFLNIAGYAVIEKQNAYHIMKTNKEIAREGLPVYINSDINQLPKSDEFIIYVHYFTNIKVGQDRETELQEIVRFMLPDDAKSEIEPNKNALIVAARSRDIINLIELLEELDKAGFKEKLEFIPLNYASANIVANLFNENILQQQEIFNRYRLDTRKKTDIHYFSPKTRIIADNRTNALIVIGHEQAVERLRDFIKRYIDVELDSGQSVLHVYHLQYLDAVEFKPVLEKIVQSSDIGATGQARGEKKVVGPERFFDEVIITVDRPADPEKVRYYGGNNLIIAARNDDWVHIKEIIESLDTPKPQVFLEVLIADLTIEDSRLLGALTRNPNKIPLINLTQFQSAQLNPGVIVDGINTDGATPGFIPTTVAGNLLRTNPLVPGSMVSPVLLPVNMTPGSTAISLNDNDGKTWSILQILKLFSHSKILSHPHIVATDGKPAYMKIGQELLVPGDITGSVGTNTVRKQEKYEAALTIKITPRISSANTVNLDVDIHIEEFILVSENPPKATRNLVTNANVLNESILTLGGLIRSNSQQGLNATPLLSQVPVLGWFFKNRNANIRENNLTVFISPTIVQPRLRKGIGTYTQDYINLAERYSEESILFDSIKDPITRLFFRFDENLDRSLDEFIDKDQFVAQDTIVPAPLPRNATNHAKASQKSQPKESTDKLTQLLKEEPNPFTKNKQQEEPVPVLSAIEYDDKQKERLLKELLKEEPNPFM